MVESRQKNNIFQTHESIDLVTYHNAKNLLKIYSDVVWKNASSYVDTVNEFKEEYGSQASYSCLEIMSELGEERKAENLRNRLLNIAENQMMIEVVEKALLHVKEYPYHGELYYDIINKNFFIKFKYTESEILETLNISRSTYFRRRKEAIYIFGVSLWGLIIPQTLKVLELYRY